MSRPPSVGNIWSIMLEILVVLMRQIAVVLVTYEFSAAIPCLVVFKQSGCKHFLRCFGGNIRFDEQRVWDHLYNEVEKHCKETIFSFVSEAQEKKTPTLGGMKQGKLLLEQIEGRT